jgi:hypothetical protein
VTTHVIVGIVAFICCLVCAITGALVVFEMVDRVNERLPEDRQFSHVWWYASKQKRLLIEYERLYPDGGLARRWRMLVVLLFAFGFVSAWGMGIFSR